MSIAKPVVTAASKLTFKDFFLLGVISGILTKSARDRRKKKKLSLAGVSVKSLNKKSKSRTVTRRK